ncbi:hypothetical protein [Sporosarcina sp. FSL K6-5500]|uniref:hypothetical protein n=1 Tax=Sporosarcina sp. FSL K6-5500 TaxID=2921558 RepID=UPI0030FA9D6A
MKRMESTAGDKDEKYVAKHIAERFEGNDRFVFCCQTAGGYKIMVIYVMGILQREGSVKR